MSSYYKLCYGDRIAEGVPDILVTRTLCPRKYVKSHIREAIKGIPEGADLYILCPDGIVKAYFRDNIALDKD